MRTFREYFKENKAMDSLRGWEHDDAKEYAIKLISKFKAIKGDEFSMDYLFSKYPKEEIKQVNEEEKTVVKPRRKRKKTK